MKIVIPDRIVNDGWLQEVNRQFFHPRGYALNLFSTDMGRLEELFEWAIAHQTNEKAKDSYKEWLEVLKNGAVVVQLRDHADEGGIEFGPSASVEQSDARKQKAYYVSVQPCRPIEAVEKIIMVQE